MRRPWKAVAIVGLLALTACGGTEDTATGDGEGRFPMTVSDCGREVVLEERPERVLTMASTAATLMWAAGGADRITARSNECGVPLGPAEDALRAVPIISPDQDLSREVIIGEQPDLVRTAGLNMTTAEDLAAVGIDSIVNSGFCDGTGSGPNPDGDVDFDDVFTDIELYGRIFGTEDVATAKVAEQIILLESPFILGAPPAVDGLEAMTEMFVGGPA